jgi:hypothetical protein
MTVWAKSWGEVIEDCSSRLRFFQEKLNYTASHSSGKKFLTDTYPKFIPNFTKDENISAEGEQDDADADSPQFRHLPQTQTPPLIPSALGEESKLPVRGSGGRSELAAFTGCFRCRFTTRM